MTRAEALAIRASMDKAGTHLTDEQAKESKAMYRPWLSDTTYAAGDMRQSADTLWKCLQAHTSQVGWEPENTPALWVEVAPAGEYREIKDGMLPTEAFALGEIGWWQTKTNLYRSLIAANTYTPVSYPAGWEQVVTV